MRPKTRLQPLQGPRRQHNRFSDTKARFADKTATLELSAEIFEVVSWLWRALLADRTLGKRLGSGRKYAETSCRLWYVAYSSDE